MEPIIIKQTDDLVAVFKPSGWLSIPGRLKAPVLLEWLKQKIGPVWVVHRLDLETSGVMIFARTEEKHRLLNYWFQERLIKKTYHCIARGDPNLPMFKISTPVRNVRASTQVEVLEKYTCGFLAQVKPLTGRRHQIRIHFYQMGYPLFGDMKYGGIREISLEGENLVIPRVALHSYSLELPTGEVFQTQWPEDFWDWVKKLKKGKKKFERQNLYFKTLLATNAYELRHHH
ncbi:MAG: RNA pseudouridine synthase [Bdellovibrio sp.]|nr:RNA pseudouridine synthase [Bdellovibrio sp.]